MFEMNLPSGPRGHLAAGPDQITKLENPLRAALWIFRFSDLARGSPPALEMYDLPCVFEGGTHEVP